MPMLLLVLLLFRHGCLQCCCCCYTLLLLLTVPKASLTSSVANSHDSAGKLQASSGAAQ
jgi:hypothetical protein